MRPGATSEAAARTNTGPSEPTVRCVAEDQRGCKNQGGYSDRVVTKIRHFDGQVLELTEAEREEVEDHFEGRARILTRVDNGLKRRTKGAT